MRVTEMTAGAGGDRVHARGVALVAHVVDERPGAVERGGPEIIGIPRHHVAGGMADAPADALDAGVGGLSSRGRRRHDREIVRRLRGRLEMALGALPLVEERAHVDGKVPHHGEIAQRLEAQHRGGTERGGNARAAGPTWAAVDRHGAGAAHADAAGKAIGERRVLLALDVGDHVEHGLVRAARHVKCLETAGRPAAPHLDRERFRGGRHGSTRIDGRSPGSTSTIAPSGIAAVMSTSKPEIMVKSASAAPCTMIGLTALSTRAAGITPRAVISCSIQAVATPPLAASSTSTRPTKLRPASLCSGRENTPRTRSRS